MATARASLTPHHDPIPATVEIARELSGAQWVHRFPGSRSTDDLVDPFRASVTGFIAALQQAGIVVRVSATYRPRERAYLMHYCVKIANGTKTPADVGACDGVDIEWDHGDLTASRAAARAMASGYQIVFPAAFPTRHSDRVAIDMTLSSFVGTVVIDARGRGISIKKGVRPVSGRRDIWRHQAGSRSSALV